MKKSDCTGFLQQVLPQMQMQWRGFCKVSKQVCKRIKRRMQLLGLADFSAYYNHLQRDKDEWRVLDEMCRITISRFYRDRGFFDFMGERVLLDLAKEAEANRINSMNVWSVGAASGEEAYTLMIIWEQCFSQKFPDIVLNIIATDSDEHMLKRARTACYTLGSLKDLPKPWLNKAFEQKGRNYCLKEHYKHQVQFLQQDIRRTMPEGMFDLILCRNLVFTYFEKSSQHKILAKMEERLRPGGYLAIGIHESLPEGSSNFTEVSGHNRIYKKIEFNSRDTNGRNENDDRISKRLSEER